MDTKKIEELAMCNQLTTEAIAVFLTEHQLTEFDKIFQDLAERTSVDWGWSGFNTDFSKTICELNNPELMLSYVTHYLNDDEAVNNAKHLSRDDFRWLLQHEQLDLCLKIFTTYLEKRKIEDIETQKLIYAAEHFSFFEILAAHQEVDASLQINMICEHTVRLIKLKAYISHHRLCEDAEVAFVKEKSLADLVADYAWRFGFCNRVQSGLLWRLLRRIG